MRTLAELILKAKEHMFSALDFVSFIVTDTISFAIAVLCVWGLEWFVHTLFQIYSTNDGGVLSQWQSGSLYVIQFVGSVIIFSMYIARLSIHAFKMVKSEKNAT